MKKKKLILSLGLVALIGALFKLKRRMGRGEPAEEAEQAEPAEEAEQAEPAEE